MTLSQNQILIIVLATVIPISIILILGILLFRRSRQRRYLFNRGITPIDDKEIESWKIGREKTPIIEKATSHAPAQHQQNNSVGSVRKPPSVVIYQNNHSRMSEEVKSPRSLYHKRSIDMAPAQVLARAPNSRPGLTDDTVQGDDAFIPPLKRQPSRLAKLPPTSPRHNRNRSSRSSTISHYWHGHFPDFQFTPRQSSEYLPRAGRSLDIRRHNRLHSHSFSNPPRLSFDEEVFLGGLSPRPLIRKSEIGRAIG
ncbi:Fc.00g067950.m01.CDS01 [Cosmosporella sp. VM-42]